jgi:hypothetical protein
MKLSKLQNLVNECIMIQQDYPLNWEFGVDLKEVQEELDAVKLILPVVGVTLKEAQYRPSPDIDKRMIEHGYKICD